MTSCRVLRTGLEGGTGLGVGGGAADVAPRRRSMTLAHVLVPAGLLYYLSLGLLLSKVRQ